MSRLDRPSSWKLEIRKSSTCTGRRKAQPVERLKGQTPKEGLFSISPARLCPADNGKSKSQRDETTKARVLSTRQQEQRPTIQKYPNKLKEVNQEPIIYTADTSEFSTQYAQNTTEYDRERDFGRKRHQVCVAGAMERHSASALHDQAIPPYHHRHPLQPRHPTRPTTPAVNPEHRRWRVCCKKNSTVAGKEELLH